jgi:hypothetical protein
LEETELGVATVNASGGLNFVARIKNDNNRNATSHMAVMSIDVLFLGIFILGISGPFNCFHFKIQKTVVSTNYLYREAKLCVKVKPLSSMPYVIESILVVKIL